MTTEPQLLTINVSECFVLHLDAGNDRNGNPRRCFVLAHPQHGRLDVVEEEYYGTSAIRLFPAPVRDEKHHAACTALMRGIHQTLKITVHFYHEILKFRGTPVRLIL